MNHEALYRLQRQFFQGSNMTTIDQRYPTAIRSRNLVSDPKTVRSDSDVLGAVALADRSLTRGRDGRGNPITPCPIAVPLMRLLSGDNHAAADVVQILAHEAHHHSFKLKVHITLVECRDMAQAAIAWYRHGACRLCGGHGKLLIPGTKTLGDRRCEPCHGRGRVPFDEAFRKDHRLLAVWLVSQIDRALGYAGPQAMAHLAPRFSLDQPEKT